MLWLKSSQINGTIGHPHNATAQEILNWLQGRTDPAEVIKGMETHKERLIDTGENEAKALSILRQIVVQSLLEIGARSFSHFLNAVERYIKLMRHITADTDSSADILEAITMFWKKNPQMMLITFDKFMQYQFTEPSDHIAWAFRLNNGFISAFEWEIIRAALDKVNGRVFISQKKVDQLRKEQDDALALQKAQEPTDMETEVNLDMGKISSYHVRSLNTTTFKSDPKQLH
jgi:nuclear cap-binding protein subunit 1